MSEEISELNREVNKALRAVNSLGVAVAGLRFGRVKENLGIIGEAMDALSKLQARIFEAQPELEFHHDENRADTEYMATYREHLRNAASYHASGDVSASIKALHKALEMEPPPLPYEIVIKEIERVTASAERDNLE